MQTKKRAAEKRRSFLRLLQVFVDGGGSVLARAHGEDNGGRAGDGVAARVNALTGGEARFLLSDNAAPLLGFKPRGSGLDEGVRAGAQGHDHAVQVKRKLAALFRHGAAAAGGVGLTQLHFLAVYGTDPALVVAQDSYAAQYAEENDLQYTYTETQN